MNAERRTLSQWLFSKLRYVAETFFAVALAINIALVAGVMTVSYAPNVLAFGVAVLVGIMAFVAIRIGMATVLSPVMLDETVEQWAVR